MHGAHVDFFRCNKHWNKNFSGAFSSNFPRREPLHSLGRPSESKNLRQNLNTRPYWTTSKKPLVIRQLCAIMMMGFCVGTYIKVDCFYYLVDLVCLFNHKEFLYA
jgi:hypothetical protein